MLKELYFEVIQFLPNNSAITISCTCNLFMQLGEVIFRTREKKARSDGSPERKHNFKQEYANGLFRVKPGKDEFHAHCIACRQDINLTSIGKSAISVHQKTPKHVQNVRASAVSKSLSNFMPRRSVPTAIDERATAAEGAWAYHIARHNQSFASADCVSSSGLFRTMFSDSEVAKKFSSAQTKTASVSTSVLASYSVECLLKELRMQPFSFSIDASNHKAIKLFPIVISSVFQCYKWCTSASRQYEIFAGGSAELVLQLIDGVLHSHGLRFENLVSYCADNALVNFGGPIPISKRINREKVVNILKRLQERKKNITPIGCPAHILHNAAEKGADRLTIDIESIVFKLASFCKGSSRRHEMLNE